MKISKTEYLVKTCTTCGRQKELVSEGTQTNSSILPVIKEDEAEVNIKLETNYLRSMAGVLDAIQEEIDRLGR